MTHREFFEAVKVLAGDEFCKAQIKYTRKGDGTEEEAYAAYVFYWAEEATPELCLERIRAQMTPEKVAERAADERIRKIVREEIAEALEACEEP